MFWGPSFPLRTACLLTYGKKYIYIFLSLHYNLIILSLNLNNHIYRVVCQNYELMRALLKYSYGCALMRLTVLH